MQPKSKYIPFVEVKENGIAQFQLKTMALGEKGTCVPLWTEDQKYLSVVRRKCHPPPNAMHSRVSLLDLSSIQV